MVTELDGKRVFEARYLVYARASDEYAWELTSSWKHSLNSVIKCERFYRRMKGYQTKRELVE